MGENLKRVKERWAEISDLGSVQELLGWDQHTYMPPGGSAARAEQIATLQRLEHQMLTSTETRKWLDGAEREVESLDPDSDDRAFVTVARRDLEDALKLPEELVVERARTSSLALEAWADARENNLFVRFAPWLQKVIELERRVAEHRGYEDHPYDALLDLYERGARTRQVTAFFAELRERLVPLARRIIEAAGEPDSLLNQLYPIPAQETASRRLAEKIGYDFRSGRIDPTAHPFATAMSRTDVRITTRYNAQEPAQALFAALHETGHALYEQGMPEDFERTPLRGGASLGVHESQSRLWENLVGRSRGFWEAQLPGLREIFPDQLRDASVDRFYRAVNRVDRSFIRVEADEVTYNLHVLVRFKIETEMIDGRLNAADAPEVWNDRMQTHLGITPPDDRLGILQDVHWSMGAIGYFPTYTIGTLLSCQLWEAALRTRPAIPEEIRQGDTSTLLNWLRENIHRHGRKYLPDDLIQRATGAPLSAAPFLRYLEAKYSELYGLAN